MTSKESHLSESTTEASAFCIFTFVHVFPVDIETPPIKRHTFSFTIFFAVLKIVRPHQKESRTGDFEKVKTICLSNIKTRESYKVLLHVNLIKTED
jgi:hypothetical protein